MMKADEIGNSSVSCGSEMHNFLGATHYYWRVDQTQNLGKTTERGKMDFPPPPMWFPRI